MSCDLNNEGILLFSTSQILSDFTESHGAASQNLKLQCSGFPVMKAFFTSSR